MNASSRNSMPCSMAPPPNTLSRSTRSPPGPTCTSRARAHSRTASGTPRSRICSSTTPPTSSSSSTLRWRLMASAKAFRLDALCLHGKVARLCGEGAWNEAGWNARAEARNLPISTLTAGLTPRVEYQGTINATANLRGSRGAPLVGDARADLVDAAIRHKLASGRTDVISFGSGFVTLNAQPDHMIAELQAGRSCARPRSRAACAPIAALRTSRAGRCADSCRWPPASSGSSRSTLRKSIGPAGSSTPT